MKDEPFSTIYRVKCILQIFVMIMYHRHSFYSNLNEVQLQYTPLLFWTQKRHLARCKSPIHTRFLICENFEKFFTFSVYSRKTKFM